MITTIVSEALGLISKFVPDRDKAQQLASDIATMTQRHAHEARMEQIKTNQEAAKHPSMFVAGARPAILWICAVGFAYALIVYDIIIMTLLLTGVDPATVALIPEPRTGLLWVSMSGLLGLGGMRTFEKYKGVARENLRATPSPKSTEVGG